MKAGVAARIAASRIVGRVTRAGAWSNVLLRDLSDLPEADRPFVRALVYESLRHLALIDDAITSACSRPIGTVQDAVLDILRVGVTEIAYTRSPDHAVVDSAVEAVKEAGYPRAAGFVNGVLRSIARDGLPEVSSDIAATFGVDPWVADQLVAAWGEDATARFFTESDRPASLAVRAPASPGERAEEGPVPGTWILPPGTATPAGAVVQDPASVAVVLALDVEPGMRVLDAAAAPGGKTRQIAELRPALLVAMDRHPRRLRSAARRLGDLEMYWVQGDGRRPPFAPASFDRVLLDAPCSGLGTLRRRPEIRWKVTEAEVARLSAVQESMLDAALELLAPGGRMVYSVCTVLPQETTRIAAPRGGASPTGIPGADTGTGVLMAPHLTGTDGMFISVFTR